MTNEAVKVLMIFALYGILEVILCAPSTQKLKTVLSKKVAHAVKAEPNRAAARR